MSIERTSTGNGYTEPITNEEWLEGGGLELLAQEVVRATQLTERVVCLVEALSERVEQLEVQPAPKVEVTEPVTEDFDLDLTNEVQATELEVQVEEPVQQLGEPHAAVEDCEASARTETLTVRIEQPALLQAVKSVAKVVPHSSMNPTLTNLKLTFEDGKLTLTATDGEVWLQQTVAAITQGERELLIPAKLFQETVKGLPKVELLLDFNGDVLRIAEGGANCTISTQAAENYPELPKYADAFVTAVSTATLKRLLKMTSFAAVKESSTRAVHYTNGVLLNLNGFKLDVVATDGHRLVLARHSGVGSSTVKGTMLLPARVAKYLEQLLPDEELTVSVYKVEEQVFFRIPQHTSGKRVLKHHPAILVGCSLLDVKFPDYERVVPMNYEAKVHVNREELSTAVKRCLLVCKTKDQNPVTHFIAADGLLTITADGGNESQAEEQLACEGGGIKIALNPQYLLDVLKVLTGDDVIFNWQSETEPMTVTSSRYPDFVYILMPIRMD